MPFVVALVSGDLRARLSTRMQGVEHSSGWNDLVSRLCVAPQAVVLVDPSHPQLRGPVSEEFPERVIALKRDFPLARLIAYTRLDPQCLQQCIEPLRLGICELVLVGFDDTPERLSRSIEASGSEARFPQFHAELERLLRPLPDNLRAAVRIMFEQPGQVRTTGALACSGGMSKRSLFRHLNAAGIQSGRRLVASARLLLAYRLLVDHQRSVKEVARSLSYTSSDQLCVHFHTLTGYTPSQIKAGVSADEICSALLAALMRNSSGRSMAGAL